MDKSPNNTPKDEENRDKQQDITDELSLDEREQLIGNDEEALDRSYKVEAFEFDYIKDYKQAMLNFRTPITSMLIYTIALFFFIAIVWSHFAVIDEVTHSSGKVIPPSKLKVIQSLEGGILKKMYVHEGERVKKGQILLQIDETQFQSYYREEYSKYLHVLSSVARLRAEIDDKSSITFPKALQDHKSIMALETELFNERKKNLATSIDLMKKTQELIENEIAMTRPLVAEGVSSRIELLRLERQLNELQSRISDKQDHFSQSAHKELTVFNAELERLKQVIRSREDKLDRTTVHSPVDGVVQAVHIMTRGGVISPGMKIMEIVPQEPYSIIEAKIIPADIGFIKLGQEVKIKLSAYDYAIFGGLKGHVTHISADTFSDEKGNVFYKINVRADTNYIEKNNKRLPIKIGMQSNVDIITGHKTIMTYLLKPILRAKENAFVER